MALAVRWGAFLVCMCVVAPISCWALFGFVPQPEQSLELRDVNVETEVGLGLRAQSELIMEMQVVLIFCKYVMVYCVLAP